jgi:hypothetical protein
MKPLTHDELMKAVFVTVPTGTRHEGEKVMCVNDIANRNFVFANVIEPVGRLVISAPILYQALYNMANSLDQLVQECETRDLPIFADVLTELVASASLALDMSLQGPAQVDARRKHGRLIAEQKEPDGPWNRQPTKPLPDCLTNWKPPA